MKEKKMLTPSDMRIRAHRNLVNADLILRAGDPDGAAYQAGHAAEMLLKARYCTISGLPALPSDKRALAAHRLNQHDLSKLLELSHGVQLDWHAMDKIDWKTITAWHNEDRYEHVGSLDAHEAAERITQTKRLLTGIIQFELVSGVASTVDSLTRDGVDFNLLALSEGDASQWNLVMASRYFDDAATRTARAHRVVHTLRAAVPYDVRTVIGKADWYGIGDDVPMRFYKTGSVSNGGMRLDSGLLINLRPGPPVRSQGISILSKVLVDGFLVPRSYVVTMQPPNFGNY